MADHSLGTLSAEVTADTASFEKGMERVSESMEQIKHVGEALGLEMLWEKLTEVVKETTQAFAEHEAALRRVSAVTSGMDTAEKFEELADSLASVTTHSADTYLSITALLGKFNLTDRQIAEMLPHLADFAAGTGTDITEAATRMGRAVASGEASVRRLGLDLGEAGRAAFKAADETGRYNILVQAMGRFTGQAAEEASTAAGVQEQLHNATEKFQETVGGLLNQPMAEFFQHMTEKVQHLTEWLNNLSPEMKEEIGYVLDLGVKAAETAIAIGAVALSVQILGSMSAPIGEAVGAMQTLYKISKEVALLDLGVQFEKMSIALWEMGGVVGAMEKLGVAMKGIASAAAAAAAPFAAVAAAVTAISSGAVEAAGLFALSQQQDKLEKLRGGSIMDVLKAGWEEGKRNTFGGGDEQNGSGGGLDFNGSHGQLGPDLSDFSDKQKQDKWAGTFAAFGQDGGAKQTAMTGLYEQRQKDEEDELKGLAEEIDARRELWTAIQAQQLPAIREQVQHTQDLNKAYTTSIAGLEQTGRSLLSRLGPAGSTIGNAVDKFSKGDVAGGITTIGVDLLTRTKAFKDVSAHLESAFDDLANILEPFVEVISNITGLVSDAIHAVFGSGDSDKALIMQVSKTYADTLNSVHSAASDAAKSLNSVTAASLNVADGFKVALDRFNSTSSIGSPGSGGGGPTPTGHGSGYGSGSLTGGATTSQTTTSQVIAAQDSFNPNRSGTGAFGTTNHTSSQSNTQIAISVASDKFASVLAEVQKQIAQKDYLNSGMNTVGQTTRSQYAG